MDIINVACCGFANLKLVELGFVLSNVAVSPSGTCAPAQILCVSKSSAN